MSERAHDPDLISASIYKDGGIRLEPYAGVEVKFNSGFGDGMYYVTVLKSGQMWVHETDDFDDAGEMFRLAIDNPKKFREQTKEFNELEEAGV